MKHTLYDHVLISLFPVDSAVVDFVVAVAAVHPTQCDIEQYESLAVNEIMLLFDNLPIRLYLTLCLPSMPNTSNVNQIMMFLPKYHPD